MGHPERPFPLLMTHIKEPLAPEGYKLVSAKTTFVEDGERTGGTIDLTLAIPAASEWEGTGRCEFGENEPTFSPQLPEGTLIWGILGDKSAWIPRS